MNQPKRALEFFTIAAHLTKRDADLWRHVAIMSKQLGDKNKAIYCFGKVLKLDPDDPEALWERSSLYAETGDLRRAIEGFEILAQKHPHPEVSKELAKVLHNKNGSSHKVLFVISIIYMLH